ncbi:MAG: hypothetical protein LBV12_03145 [Puniceicoccales bacterium]|jgi:hypothetical protein|nr:hypothetical protein [Puniceicoccales bacterium]
MGQFLAMGLAHEMRISLDGMRKEKISKEELRQGIQESLLFDLTLYDEAEMGEYLLFTIKNEVLETGLIPFLEVLYPMVYREHGVEDYRNLLKQLRSTPLAEWLNLAQEDRHYAFQFDRYGKSDYIRIPKDFRPVIRVHPNYLMLYAGSGKIATEGIEDFMRFFKLCIHATFKEHPLAKAIRVYITG